jgi:hypothetical protein
MRRDTIKRDVLDSTSDMIGSAKKGLFYGAAPRARTLSARTSTQTSIIAPSRKSCAGTQQKNPAS